MATPTADKREARKTLMPNEGDTVARRASTYQAVFTAPPLNTGEPPPPNAKLVLLASHAITKLGSKAWEFATPLLLLNFNPKTLFAPVAFGLITTACSPLLGPVIGAWADTSAPSRLTVVFKGCFVQGCTSALTVVFLAALLSLGEGAFTGPAAVGHMSPGALLLFACVAACGVLENLAAGAVSVAVEKDWVPAVFERPLGVAGPLGGHGDDNTGGGDDNSGGGDGSNMDELTSVNAAMSRIDLCAEFVGPLLAGAVLTVCGAANPLRGFAAIGFFNALTFAPQYALLHGLYRSCSRLRVPKAPPTQSSVEPLGDARSGGKTAQSSEGTALVGGGSGAEPWWAAWPVWCGHPGGVPLVSTAYALLYFTALSPHGIPLTAFLASHGGVGPLALSVFRGAGAAAGILGLTTFEVLKERAGLRVASVVHLVFQAAAVLLAAQAFAGGGTALFMAGVVGSRVGLYGFDVGFMELQQRNVEERDRNAVGSVDNALTSFATFAVYACSLHVASTAAWASLTWASATSVGVALTTFTVYLLLWKESSHTHTAGGEGDDRALMGHAIVSAVGPGAAHRHTTQQRRALRPDGTHAHVHYVGPHLCGVGGHNDQSHGQSHGHSHDHSHP